MKLSFYLFQFIKSFFLLFSDVIEEDVWVHFESCGVIKGVRVKHDNRKAHILFEVCT